MTLDILQDDEYLIAANKPAGLLPVLPPPTDKRQPAAGTPTLLDEVKKYLLKRYKREGGIYLELICTPDTEAGGIALFAKNNRSAQRLKTDLQNRKFLFEFWALSAHRPKLETGRLVHFLRYAYDKDMMQVFTTHQPNTQKAVLQYELLAALANSNLLVAHTGNYLPQQVRAQFARIGCPIRGDKKYGETKTPSAKQTYLHLCKLTFTHPHSEQQITLSAKIDEKDNYWRFFAHFED
ncbi:RNA pseudouridine synthase [Sphingobacteriales bacterium UPWRP_1]|nr:hypothetical protein BVG80_12025 [Sphingobacteriales bacterium TSM_CSM]PSJ77950.1 RNA pseudouridine synthase [Sphingobacteriales bacterium UPWRP_1]